MDFEKERIAGLLKELKNGNKEVFEEFYKLTSPRAYFIALKIVRNEHDAEDILQESYIKLLESIKDIDPDRNFAAWFYKIVANKSKDFLKKQKLLVFEGEDEEIIDAIPDDNPQFCPEENLNQDELCSEVMAAIDELTAEKRACIMMRYFGEMSVNEIAESLEVPVSTVKNRLFTARKDLKNKFEKRGSTVLYSAAPIGVVAWALGKSSQAVSASFAASAASAEVLASVGAAGGITVAASSAASATAAAATTATATTATTATAAAATTAAASTAASTAAATGAGVAAKVAALSVAQKVVIGAVAAGVVGGSTAGVATVVKENTPPPTTTEYIVEEVTTAPSQVTEYVFAFYETEPETAATEESATETTKREPTATHRREKTTEEQTESAQKEETTVKKSTTRKSRNKTTLRSTTRKNTTTEMSTAPTTTEKTTRETTTKPTTTRKVTTTKTPTTAKPATTKPTTTKQITTTMPTTAKTTTTTEPATQSPATLIIEVTDFDNSVVETITVNVDAGTELSRDYLVALVSSNGYEAMAGVYGDAIGSVAESGQTYSFTAEL